jgi:hypothetical protein
MRRHFVLPALAAMMAACQPHSQNPEDAAVPDPVGMDSIAFERTPCFGTCPVYLVVLRSDLSATLYPGPPATRGSGDPFRISESAWQAVKERYVRELSQLDAAYTYGSPKCGLYVTDAPGGVITAFFPASRRRLEFDQGCGSLPAAIPRFGAFIDSVGSVKIPSR